MFISIPNNLVTFDLSQVNREEIDEPHELLVPRWQRYSRRPRGVAGGRKIVMPAVRSM